MDRKPPAVPDDHPLDATGDLALALGGSPDSWTGKVLELLAGSDDEHVARLAAGIPDLVFAYRLWRKTEETPTAGEFLALLDAAVATRDIRDIRNPPPTELWIGKADGEWPVRAFISEAHLSTYLKDGEAAAGSGRRAWKVEDFTLVEVELSPPVERAIRPRGTGTPGDPQ